MKRAICKAILRMAGWKLGSSQGVELPKCIVCVAPHTSNWDFILGQLFYTSIGCNAGFLIKKEWFFFPFNHLFNWLGGVPVHRGKRASVTEQMVEVFNTRSHFQLAVTPEGTRKPAKEWKKGFYYIAAKANVPILMAYFDYGKKEVGIKGIFYPTGDTDSDIRAIRMQYRGVTARHPKNFISV